MIQLGKWHFDPGTRRLKARGEEKRLSPKSCQVLMTLIEANGAVVSRDTLLDTVWGGVTVGEEVLTHAIADLRRAFSDDFRAPEYLETVHKSGYRLLKTTSGLMGETEKDHLSPPEPVGPKPDIFLHRPEESTPFQHNKERKIVTILDCTIANAMTLGRDVGAEVMDGIMDEVWSITNQTMERFGGTLSQKSSDGFTALCGAQNAVDDHIRRALAASVEIRDRVASMMQTEKHNTIICIRFCELLPGSMGTGNCHRRSVEYRRSRASRLPRRRLRRSILRPGVRLYLPQRHPPGSAT